MKTRQEFIVLMLSGCAGGGGSGHYLLWQRLDQEASAQPRQESGALLIFEIDDLVTNYPAKLASLDLDLAVAPLEVHPYNDTKSNLRLLELGAMGYPMICSAGVGAFDGDLPVTRVDNRPDAWIDAITSAIVDRQALAEQGDVLRRAIT